MNPQPFLATSRIIDLISGYLQESLDPESLDELQKWRDERPQHEELFHLLTSKAYQQQELSYMSGEETDLAYTRIQAKLRPHTNYRLWISIAAAVLISVITLVKYFTPDAVQQKSIVKVLQDVAPGSNKATLTLADGRSIDLNAASNGILVKQQGVSIYKTADGELISQAESNASINNPGINTIITPKGGTYSIILPDGSKVTLNAGTTLSYPVTFNTAIRKVTLSGEAFFAIRKDKRHPFIVESAGQQVTVLGTQFNVNSYKDEPATITTLVEGSVKLSAQASQAAEWFLKPGEQALMKEGKAKTSKADVQNNIAWYRGELSYQDADIQTIMRQISRWYDVTVTYPNGIPDNRYTGSIDRKSSLSTVLAMFRIGGMKFRIEEVKGEKKLVINP